MSKSAGKRLGQKAKNRSGNYGAKNSHKGTKGWNAVTRNETNWHRGKGTLRLYTLEEGRQ